jgi:hypothetical protein
VVHTLSNVPADVFAVRAPEDIFCHKTNLVKESNTFAVTEKNFVQGDPDLETFHSLYFHFRESTLSDLVPSLAICLYVYITICTPPSISPLYHTVLKTGGKANIKTNDYSPLKKG